MLRQVDGVAIRIMDPVFGLAVRRPLIDPRRGIELFACPSQAGDILDLKTEVI
jgi:hypothetical protein